MEEEGYFAEENIGSFYMIHETRPYIRALGTYMDDLIGLGKFRAAIRAGLNIIRLNENDNLGIRYDLMALYAFMEDVSSAGSSSCGLRGGKRRYAVSFDSALL